ncbi:LuxR family transcriptional regulator [Lentzea sp. NBRC 105346]|uniref:alpha/beta fold hydrolase n=1 Tax=Lentzea sp. NBRC 105346 TaxID=3032205 RepID=UPI0024A1C055|nr:alpha/beta fold hydrolase [Lentzea sp. NBRC 105346]GLZ33594.1 LuxR family transcriptional regulator [Lentzea sp. NBRC 105346]
MAEQTVRFTRVRGRTVAWAAVGSGPPLVLGGWWCGHLELDWRSPLFRAFCEGFADRFTVIRYDRPGTGLSNRDDPVPASLDEEVEVLAAVVAAAGPPVSLFGGSSGSCIATAYAATHPVTRLVLYGAYARGADIPGGDAVLAAVRTHWGVGSRLLAEVFVPDGTAADRAELVRFQREAASPAAATEALAAVYRFDVQARLPLVTAPTLVLHRRDDRAIPFALGRDVASRIPGARFVSLAGTDHFPWRGDASAIVEASLGFLGDAPALTDREVEILRLVAQGLSDHEIAARLFLSPHTVHRHVANIRTKLGLPSRTAAAAHAVKAGLI